MHANSAPPKPVLANALPVPDCLLTAINMLSLGIVLVDGESRIAFANRAAEALLPLREGSRIGGQTRGQSRSIAAILDRQLRVAIKRGRTIDERHVAVTVVGGRPLYLMSVPCDAHDEAPSEPMDIIFVGGRSHHAAQDLSPIVSHYRLTRAETRLLQALVRGDTIGAYARRAGITVNTAKGYLKQLFRKTSTTRQSDLVRLILANPILHLVAREEIAVRRE